MIFFSSQICCVKLRIKVGKLRKKVDLRRMWRKSTFYNSSNSKAFMQDCTSMWIIAAVYWE